LYALLRAAKTRASKENWCIDIDLPFLLALLERQEGKCYYTGQLLTYETGDHGVSMDRRDPDLGYTQGNVVLVLWIINNMKRHLSESVFLSLCKAITT